MKLYELTDELLAVVESITNWQEENESTDCPPDLLDRLRALRAEDGEKLRGCWCYLKNLDAEIEAIKTEQRRLAARRDALENKFDGFKNYVAAELNGAPFKHREAHFAWRQNPPSVDPNIDMTQLPECYVKIERSPLKRELLNDLKAGAEIPGARLQDGKRSLIIK